MLLVLGEPASPQRYLIYPRPPQCPRLLLTTCTAVYPMPRLAVQLVLIVLQFTSLRSRFRNVQPLR